MARWICALVAGLVTLPLVVIASALGVISATNSLDPAYSLGISDLTLTMALFAVGGLVTGVTVSFIAGVRTASMIVPSLASAISAALFPVVAFDFDMDINSPVIMLLSALLAVATALGASFAVLRHVSFLPTKHRVPMSGTDRG
jgi:hypothetical protein